MSKIPKVSIIVPIYNVERYLSKCLESICRQTLRDIEIICVNDGSTDGSVDILKMYQKKDKRIKCITKKNSGYGDSMNKGFAEASGEYIGIVESDDFIEANFFEFLYNIAKQVDLDLVKSDYYTFYDDAKQIEYVMTCSDESFYYKLIGIEKDSRIFEFRMNTWTGIYKKDFIVQNKIKYNESPGASYQDNGFWFQTISLAKRMMFVNRAFYHYRQDNPNSSINSKKKLYCMNDEYDFIYKFLESNQDIHKKYFVPYLKKRFYNCMTTYERVNNDDKILFLKRFSEDLKDLIRTNNFHLELLNDRWMEGMIQRICDDYYLFFYEDMTYRYTKRRELAIKKLNVLRQSEELKKGLTIRNIFIKN